jgi:hypothetical protein
LVVVRPVAAISSPVCAQRERLDVPRDRRRVLDRHDQLGGAAGVIAAVPESEIERLAVLCRADEGAIYPRQR